MTKTRWIFCVLGGMALAALGWFLIHTIMANGQGDSSFKGATLVSGVVCKIPDDGECV